MVGMLLGLLVACWPLLLLLLLLLLLEMLLLVLMQELGDVALQQLALGMAAEAQMVAMMQALLIQLETVIWGTLPGAADAIL